MKIIGRTLNSLHRWPCIVKAAILHPLKFPLKEPAFPVKTHALSTQDQQSETHPQSGLPGSHEHDQGSKNHEQ
jgi:hypothetical protein